MPNKIKNRIELIKKIAYVLLLISVIIILLLIVKLLFNGYLNPKNNLDFDILKSVGSFLGGTIAPLLTMASVLFLAINYYENTLKKFELYVKSKKEEWWTYYNNLLDKLADKQQVCYLTIDNSLTCFKNIEDARIHLVNGIHEIIHQGITGISNNNKYNLIELISVLEKLFTNYMFIVSEIELLPYSNIKERDELKERSRILLDYSIPLGVAEYVKVYFILSELGVIEKSPSIYLYRDTTTYREIKLVLEQYNLLKIWNEKFKENIMKFDKFSE